MQLTQSKLLTFAGLALLMIWAMTEPTDAARVNLNHPAFAASGSSATSIPIGHSEFCKKHRSECAPNARVIEAEVLTEAKWNELLRINSDVNTSTVAVTDEKLYKTVEFWTYPNGYGDCEDFALAKRRELIRSGWDPSTLLISVVRQRNGEGHAVLMVRTDRGDLVLDNLDGLIRVWNETPYRFIKRQSQAHSGRWVDLYDNRTGDLASR